MERKPLSQVFAENQEKLLSISGVQGFYEGADEKGEPRIVIMVDAYTEELKEALPDSIEGYPVVVEVTGEIKPLDKKKRSP